MCRETVSQSTPCDSLRTLQLLLSLTQEAEYSKVDIFLVLNYVPRHEDLCGSQLYAPADLPRRIESLVPLG
jgi:hypothetical protein